MLNARGKSIGDRGRRHRRGVALVLVLFVTAIAVTLAYTYATAGGTSLGIARNIENRAKARCVAESGLELAMAYVRANDNWRSVKSEGTWVAGEAFGDGTFSVVGADGADIDGDGAITQPGEGDGDLADDDQDPLTLTVTGKVSGITHIVRAVLTPQGQSSAMAHFKLDEGAGRDAEDSTGKTSTAELQNDPFGFGWSTGTLDGAFSFDGSNDYFETPSSASELQVGDEYTASVWIYADSDQKNWAGIFSRCSPSGNENHFTLQFNGGGGTSKQLTVYHPNGNSWQSSYTLGECRDAWHNLAVTYRRSPARVQLYVDGVLHSESSSLTQGPGSGDGKLHIGADRTGTSSHVYHGKIDDLRIYNRVLAPEEIATLVGESQWGNDTEYASGQRSVADLQIATPITITNAATLTGICAYVKGPSSKDLRYAVYSDGGGRPGVLLAESAAERVGSNSYHWHTIPIDGTSVGPGTYWLALAFEHGNMYYKYANGGQVAYKYRDAVRYGFQGSWGSSDATQSRTISIYAIGTSSGAGGEASSFSYAADWQPVD